MTSPFSDELISAYLDGELTAEEQAHVESQLRDSAELRRMCDELRALRNTLQSLPWVEPTIDLTDRVLRQAERRMLSDGASDGASDGISEHSEAPPGAPGPARTGRLLRDWRVVAGAVASLAALLLLALWLPNQSGHYREVATSQQAPDASPLRAHRESVPAVDVEVSRAERLEATYSMPANAGARLSVPQSSLLEESVPQRGVEGEEGRQIFDSPAAVVTSEEQKVNEQNSGEMGGDGPAGGGRPYTPSAGDGAPQANHFGASDRSMQSREEQPSTVRSLTPLPSGSRGESQPPSRVMTEPEAAGGASAPAGAANQPALATDPAMRSAAEPELADGALPARPEATPEGLEARHLAVTSPYFNDTAARDEVGRQLISDFDQHQALLVQVSLPESEDRDSSDWLFQRAGDLVRISGSQDSVQTMGQSLPEIQLYLSWYDETKQDRLQDAPELKQRLAFPVKDVVLVEGTADAVRASLAKLAVQPEVQVVATASSQEEVRSVSTAVDNLQRFEKVTDAREGAPGMGAYPGMGGPAGFGSASPAPSAMGLGGGLGDQAPGNLNDQRPESPLGVAPDARGGYPGMQGAYPRMFGGGMGGAAAGQLPGQIPQAPSSRGKQNLMRKKEGASHKSDAIVRSKGSDAQRRAVTAADEAVPESGLKRLKVDSRALELEKLSESLQDATVTGDVAAAKSPTAKSDLEQPEGDDKYPPGAAGKNGSEDVRLKSEAADEDSAVSQPATRRVVTFLFRLTPEPVSPAPEPAEAAEPVKQD